MCAEDPANGFLPSIGTLSRYTPPRGTGVRVDDGYEEGMTIPIYYDNMLAKLITYGSNRDEAIARMSRAIAEFHIEGIATTLAFGSFVMQHPAFVSGDFDTHFIAKHFTPESLSTETNEGADIAARFAAHFFNTARPVAAVTPATATTAPAPAVASMMWRRRYG